MRADLVQNDRARSALGAARTGPQTASWSSYPPFQRARPRRRILAGFEWFFLLLGLLALDCYIWVNTAASLDQAYGDWSFDQTLLGAKASVTGFIADEIGWLFHKAPPSIAPPDEKAEKAQPIPPAVKALQPGALIGRLRIPRLNVAVMVREGATESTLSRAVGHIPGTGLPGQLGNVGLAGHRDTFFRPLRNVRKDDAIDLDTGRGTIRYLVTSTQIVSPRDVGVLKASAGKTLTLVTCYPFYYVGSAPKRFIVQATEVQSNTVAPNAAGLHGIASGRIASKRTISEHFSFKRVASNRRRQLQPGS